MSLTISHQAADSEIRRLFAQLDLVTVSPQMLPILRQARKAASVSDVTVLIEGETGTGKQVLARAIHRLDQKRRVFPFVTVHCSTVAEALAESELFGHSRGAFTGAVSERQGLFHAANHGTLLLDDINDLPLALQPKLLDVMQRGVIRPVGSDREQPLDVRIIAACNQPLQPLVQQNRFRPDLYHRLNVIRLCLPPLRERPQDLAELVLAFAHRHRALYQPIAAVAPELVAVLRKQSFPGNVRELENAVQRMLFNKTEGTALGLDEWLAQATETGHPQQEDPLGEAAASLWKAISTRHVPFSQAIREIEKKTLENALRAGGGNRRELARQLKTSERTLYYKMRSHRVGNHDHTDT